MNCIYDAKLNSKCKTTSENKITRENIKVHLTKHKHDKADNASIEICLIAFA